MKELYIISTPIGNMEDITLRAIRLLKELKLLIVEDTRTVKKLLTLLNISIQDKRIVSYYKGKEGVKSDYILEKIEKYDKAGLVSEAGTPLISDPGLFLIKRAKEKRIKIISVPGPTALISALTISGINSENFIFLGFLPKSEQKIIRYFNRIKTFPFTIIFYESPKRITKTIKILKNIIPNRKIAIIREITKKFEETIEGTITDVFEIISKREIKGEITVIMEGNNKINNNPKTKREIIKILSSVTTLSDKKIEKLISDKYNKE